jgi:transmembrane sensor
MKHWLSGAAALVFGLCLPLLPQQIVAAPTVYTTRVGEQRTVTLDDGSQITLSSGTTIVVQSMGRYREIDVVHGETFFNNPANSRRPMRVFTPLGMVAGDARAFDVLQTEREFRVIAVQGELSVLSGNWAREVLAQEVGGRRNRDGFKHLSLRAGDVAIVRSDPTMDISVEPHFPSDIERLLAWRDGILAFSNEPAQAVVESFNRYNRQKLAIADAGISTLRLSGTFQLADPKSFVLALQRIYPATKIIAEPDPASGTIRLRRRTAPESQSGRKMDTL